MDIESTGSYSHQLTSPQHNNKQQENDLALLMKTSLTITETSTSFGSKQQQQNSYFGNTEQSLFNTPEKETYSGVKGYCQTTLTKPRNNKREHDGFSTPPRRPYIPTSHQMQVFLREERQHNRRK